MKRNDTKVDPDSGRIIVAAILLMKLLVAGHSGLAGWTGSMNVL